MNEHSLIGKIARLPKSIREKLNRRLDDGRPARDILPWLNALPAVKKILDAQFAGAPINEANLSNWRANGFKRWQKKQESIARLKQLGEEASDISSAARGRLARGAASIAAAQILKFLDSVPLEKRSARDALKAAAAITSLLKADQNNVRLKLAKRKIRQKDAQLLLMRDKHHRDVAAIALRCVHDERVKLIEAAPVSFEEKIEIVGIHLFGDLWQPRLLPSSNPPTPVPPKPSGEGECPPPKTQSASGAN